MLEDSDLHIRKSETHVKILFTFTNIYLGLPRYQLLF